MRPQLAAVAAQQGGLITRRQALAAGMTERELRTHTKRDGPWVVVRRGVYAERELWASLDEHVGQWALRDQAAHLTMTQAHVMSHDSAARAQDIPLLRPQRPLVHVTRRGVGGSRTRHGVKHHLAKASPVCVEIVRGMPVTDLARTAVDVGREHGFTAGVIAADTALRRGVRRAQLVAQLEVERNFPDITGSRAAVEFADPGAENMAESLGRMLVDELGVGRAQTQFAVRVADGRVMWCDLRIGCHLFEIDGKIKIIGREQGGVADRPAEDVLWDEKKRQVLVCAEGLGMSRIVWDDYWGDARERALLRLRREFDLTVLRHGTRLPDHLAEFDQRMRGRRRRTA